MSLKQTLIILKNYSVSVLYYFKIRSMIPGVNGSEAKPIDS